MQAAMMAEYPYFCSNLKFLREERHMQQGEVAELIGVCNHTISAWERGQNVPKGKHIIRELAALFNVGARELTHSDLSKEGSSEFPWIPCSADTNPKRDGWYMVTFDGEIAGEEDPFTSIALFENGKWVDDTEDCQLVYGWHPLPKPMKVIRKEKKEENGEYDKHE